MGVMNQGIMKAKSETNPAIVTETSDERRVDGWMDGWMHMASEQSWMGAYK